MTLFDRSSLCPYYFIPWKYVGVRLAKRSSGQINPVTHESQTKVCSENAMINMLLLLMLGICI